ncbi:Na+/H+ antiporter subunit G [Salinicoccus cyprini]|uniref:Na+/H+ antiporter subunit G n=1 Tax=Salinicoccus cyprini TaxID=2493691 RepID=A0A558AWW0_9STAP|nr:monovalent cation/H(+) antiporter subunit G [Salinicoccus cyprini]TVT28747.1 Na+/H+ antiporter subunit G [Salinicoccus cyprini]
MIDIIMTSIITFFILAGAFLAAVSAIGVIRLPDVYTRLHASSKSSTLGVMMMMLGAFLYFWFVDGYVDSKLFLAVLFIFITAPVSAHMLSRSAFHSNISPYRMTVINELARDEEGAIELPNEPEEHEHKEDE